MNPIARNPMQRRLITLLVVVMVLALSTSVAFAGKVHFNKSNPPTFTANDDLTLTATGTVYGLGNGDVLITLDAQGTANLLCTNPGGSSKVPGQNPNFSASGSGSFPASEIKNGHLDFTVTTNPPQSPVPGAPDCPNSGWTETITSITWTSATINVYQFGELQLSQTFSIP
jgi:hypothetical protein